MYIPFLDHVISQMTDRFSAHFEVAKQLSCLVPGFSGFRPVSPCRESDIAGAIDFYSPLIDADRVVHELRAWNAKWFGATANAVESEPPQTLQSATAQLPVTVKLPSTALDTLEACNANYYPNVHKLLTILATLPVTTATAERSFSTLRRLKTYLRSTMTADRLTSLALLHIHNDVPCPVDEVIDRFACESRRTNFKL